MGMLAPGLASGGQGTQGGGTGTSLSRMLGRFGLLGVGAPGAGRQLGQTPGLQGPGSLGSPGFMPGAWLGRPMTQAPARLAQPDASSLSGNDGSPSAPRTFSRPLRRG